MQLFHSWCCICPRRGHQVSLSASGAPAECQCNACASAMPARTGEQLRTAPALSQSPSAAAARAPPAHTQQAALAGCRWAAIKHTALRCQLLKASCLVCEAAVRHRGRLASNDSLRRARTCRPPAAVCCPGCWKPQAELELGLQPLPHRQAAPLTCHRLWAGRSARRIIAAGAVQGSACIQGPNCMAACTPVCWLRPVPFSEVGSRGGDGWPERRRWLSSNLWVTLLLASRHRGALDRSWPTAHFIYRGSRSGEGEAQQVMWGRLRHR
jgi:hypothetical protein